MSARPVEVPDWAICEQVLSDTEWRWTDPEGWIHVVSADRSGKVHKRVERVANRWGDCGFPAPAPAATDHTVHLVGVEKGDPRWGLECDHEGDVDANCDVQSWWAEDGIGLVDIAVLPVQQGLAVRAVWRSGVPVLVGVEVVLCDASDGEREDDS